MIQKHTILRCALAGIRGGASAAWADDKTVTSAREFDRRQASLSFDLINGRVRYGDHPDGRKTNPHLKTNANERAQRGSHF